MYDKESAQRILDGDYKPFTDAKYVVLKRVDFWDEMSWYPDVMFVLRDHCDHINPYKGYYVNYRGEDGSVYHWPEKSDHLIPLDLEIKHWYTEKKHG